MKPLPLLANLTSPSEWPKEQQAIRYPSSGLLLIKIGGYIKKIEAEHSVSASMKFPCQLMASGTDQYFETALSFSKKPTDLKFIVGEITKPFVRLELHNTFGLASHGGSRRQVKVGIYGWDVGFSLPVEKEENKCYKVELVLTASSNSAPTYSHLEMCRSPLVTDVVLQLIGTEEREGPTVRVELDAADEPLLYIPGNSSSTTKLQPGSNLFKVSLMEKNATHATPLMTLSAAMVDPNAFESNSSISWLERTVLVQLTTHSQRWKARMVDTLSRVLDLSDDITENVSQPKSLPKSLSLLSNRVPRAVLSLQRILADIAPDAPVVVRRHVSELADQAAQVLMTQLQELHELLAPYHEQLTSLARRLTSFLDFPRQSLERTKLQDRLESTRFVLESLRNLDLENQQSVWALVSRWAGALRTTLR
ncbi:uncharacterized protein LOC125179341, partial [Hyalella azteca]|uniref:Uncharacterized protein LOC125179341 n=1 Tax=Hyalella azteca TaxID=294128 RepID=A0A979FUS6_HYAAZ